MHLRLPSSHFRFLLQLITQRYDLQQQKSVSVNIYLEWSLFYKNKNQGSKNAIQSFKKTKTTNPNQTPKHPQFIVVAADFLPKVQD